jgi:hypothetical protein
MYSVPWVYQFLNIDFTSIELVCTRIPEITGGAKIGHVRFLFFQPISWPS